MKRLSVILAALFVCLSSAVQAASYKIPVGEFSELELSDNINVVYSSNPDSVGYVAFETEPEYARYIIATNNGGKLRLQLEQEGVEMAKKPTLYVYSSFLSKIENTKDSTLYVSGVKPAAKISVTLQGNGKIVAKDLDATNLDLKLLTGKGTVEAYGKCDNLTINNVGTGEIRADGVVAKDVKCRIVGTGNISCQPTNTLSVGGAGTGKVYYKGAPNKVTTSKIGSIKAVKVDIAEPTVVEEEPAAEEPATEEGFTDI